MCKMFEMSNEDLAIRIADGEKELTLQLWLQVEKFIAVRAKSYFSACKLNGSISFEIDDLIQEAYFAMLAAVKYFNPELGSYISILDYCLKTAFAKVTGRMTSKQQNDGLKYSFSGDIPVSDENDETLINSIPSSENIEENVIDSIYNQQLHMALEKALGMLSSEQELILKSLYFENLTIKDLADMRGCTRANISDQKIKGLKALKENQSINGLEKFLGENIDYYKKVSVTEFKSTGTSAVEKTVLKREELTAKWLKKHYKITAKKDE